MCWEKFGEQAHKISVLPSAQRHDLFVHLWDAFNFCAIHLVLSRFFLASAMCTGVPPVCQDSGFSPFASYFGKVHEVVDRWMRWVWQLLSEDCFCMIKRRRKSLHLKNMLLASMQHSLRRFHRLFCLWRLRTLQQNDTLCLEEYRQKYKLAIVKKKKTEWMLVILLSIDVLSFVLKSVDY